MENMNDNICTRCKAKNSIITDYEIGEMVCNQCGLVYEEQMIVDEYEKRTFQDESGDNQIHRVGLPSNPALDNDCCGTKLLIRQNGKTKIIKSYSKFSKIQKNFYRIQHLLAQAQISQNLIEQTKEIYAKIAEKTNMQGRNINNIIIGIYYYVCRKNDLAKTFKEISMMFHVTERIIKKAFNSIKCDIVEPKTESQLNNIEKNYIQTFLEGDINRFDLKMLSYDIIDNFNKNEILEGKSPKTIAGLSLILSCKLLNDNLYDNKEFHSMFSNKNTLVKAYDEIKGDLNLIIPQKYADKMSVFSLDIFQK